MRIQNRSTPRIGGYKQRGIGVIELSVSLVIAAAVLFGVFFVMNQANASRVVTAEVQTVTMLSNTLRNQGSSGSSFAGLTNATLIQLGIAPENMVRDDELLSGFSTPVSVTAANVNGVANDGFEITYTNFPARQCSEFISAVSHMFSRVSIGGQVVKNTTSGNTDDEITIADMARCDATNNNVTIAFAQGR